MPTTWAVSPPTSYLRGEHPPGGAGGAGWAGAPLMLSRRRCPQPAAALPLRRLDPRLHQGHQSSGQVRGPQEAEHDRRQRRLHSGPAGEPRRPPAPRPPQPPSRPHCLPPCPQVGRAMTFHGHGFLPLVLPSDAVPLTGDIYSGLGFRSSRDSGLLYHRKSPVCGPRCGPWGSGEVPGPQAGPLTRPLPPGWDVRGGPAGGPRDTPAPEDRGENTRGLCRRLPPLCHFLQQLHRVSPAGSLSREGAAAELGASGTTCCRWGTGQGTLSPPGSGSMWTTSCSRWSHMGGPGRSPSPRAPLGSSWEACPIPAPTPSVTSVAASATFSCCGELGGRRGRLRTTAEPPPAADLRPLPSQAPGAAARV